MNNKVDPKEWAEDFKTFLESPKVSPPAHIGEEIFSVVHRDFNPALSLVLAKLAGIHVFAGSLSLLLCSQFGMGRGPSLMHVFMPYGTFTCMTICGGLFVGFTTLVAGFLLSNPEIARIRRTGYAPIFLLGVASLVIFFCFGAEIAFTIALMWLFGAVLTGVLTLELGFRFRRYGLQAS